MKKASEFYPKNGRVILHVDMNAFYCSVHEAVEPEKYKGKPIAVAGSVELRRGIVVTSSYAARDMQRRILLELGLPCSVGIAPNKLLAKMALDMKKPNGIFVLRLRDVPGVLWNKPCSALYGVGKRTAEKLTARFGIVGAWMKKAANGIDLTPVHSESEPSKSVGHTTMLPRDFTETDDIHRVFLNLADQVCRRMRKQGLIAATVQITIRSPDMKTITRSLTLETPTENADVVYKEACRLFHRHWPSGRPVRLLGITLQSLQEKSQSAIQL